MNNVLTDERKIRGRATVDQLHVIQQTYIFKWERKGGVDGTLKNTKGFSYIY